MRPPPRLASDLSVSKVQGTSGSRQESSGYRLADGLRDGFDGLMVELLLDYYWTDRRTRTRRILIPPRWLTVERGDDTFIAVENADLS